jgi:hypothetical protein
MNMATSKYCPHADRSLDTLMNKYTLPMIYDLKEYIDIQESFEIASHKDKE